MSFRGSSIDSQQSQELPESIHNNGKGICFTLTFMPLPSIAKGVKQRKNAKPKSSTQNVYINENADFSDFIHSIMQAIRSSKPAGLPYKIVGDILRTMNFDLEYSINRTQFKNISITAAKNWDEIGEHAKKGEAKLAMHEMKVQFTA